VDAGRQRNKFSCANLVRSGRPEAEHERIHGLHTYESPLETRNKRPHYYLTTVVMSYHSPSTVGAKLYPSTQAMLAGNEKADERPKMAARDERGSGNCLTSSAARPWPT